MSDYLKLTPRVLAALFMIVGTLSTVILLPLTRLQGFFWAAAFVMFLIGDSVTTSKFSKYGLEEANGPIRWICGPQPDILCTVSTRGLVLIVVGLAYLAVFRLGIGAEYHFIIVTALSLPVVLATGGFAATVVNSYAIYRSADELR